MEQTLAFLLSCFEYIAIYYLTFRLFSFHLKPYARQMAFSAILLTIISGVVRDYAPSYVDIFLQMVLFVLLLRYVFKVHLFYSVTMSFGYTGYVIMQMLLMCALNLSGLLEPIFQAESTGAFIVQTSSILLAVLISELLRMFDLRYTFVPTNVYQRVTLSGRNMLIVLLSALEVLVVAGSWYFYETNFGILYLGITLLSFAVAGGTLILLLKKEYAE